MPPPSTERPPAQGPRALPDVRRQTMTRRCLIAAILMFTPGVAGADQAADATQCRQNAGTFLAGTVVRAPRFVPGREQRAGVYLSHTRLMLRGDDGQAYDVA